MRNFDLDFEIEKVKQLNTVLELIEFLKKQETRLIGSFDLAHRYGLPTDLIAHKVDINNRTQKRLKKYYMKAIKGDVYNNNLIYPKALYPDLW